MKRSILQKFTQIYTKKGNDILFLHHKVSGGLYLNKHNAQLGPEMAETRLRYSEKVRF